MQRTALCAAADVERHPLPIVPAIGAPLAGDLVEIADIRAGERFLDVACGTGVVARLAAQRIGTTGHVAGLDPNPGMLALAWPGGHGLADIENDVPATAR